MLIIIMIFQAWVYKAPMITARYGFGIGTISDRVYVIGGRNASTYLNIVECYDATGDSWSTGYTPMPTPRYNAGSAVYNGQIYIIGGRKLPPGPTIIGRVERYDPVSNFWDTCPTMPTPREGLTCVTYGNKIYAIGGYIMGGGGRYVRTVESFDPQNNAWRREDSLNFARAGAASSALSDTLYVICGGQFSPLNSVECYAGAGWFAGNSLNRSRVGPTAVSYLDYIYACGGEAPAESVYSSIEVYDRSNHTWNFGQAMNQARSHHGSAMIGENLFVFGGKSGSAILNSCEELRITAVEECNENLLAQKFLIASPVTRGISITTYEPNWDCTIFDILGRIVAKKKIVPGRLFVKLSPGVYFVHVSKDHHYLNRKVIVL